MSDQALRDLGGAWAGGIAAAVLLAIAPAWGTPPPVIDLATDTTTIRIDGEEPEDAFGSSGAACDVDGDGIDDLVLGAMYASGIDNGRRWGGEVYVLRGRRGRWTPKRMAEDADVRILAQERNDGAGVGVACGDLNGDGFGDIVICAFGSDSKNNARNSGGQAHIVFGRASWPPVIDLATDPGTVVWGEIVGGGLCLAPRIADVNGDGLNDLALDDELGYGWGGVGWQYGRAYLLFGRRSWPGEIDLLVDRADVTFYGCGDAQQRGDDLGSSLQLGDLDGDGTADVVLGVALADGAGDQRSNAGEIAVFRGRPSWPADVDLCVASPDMRLVGRDAGDAVTSGPVCLAIGDTDGDGERELLIGASYADGEGNLRPNAGEAYVFEPGETWPAFVDLRTTELSVVYGADKDDRCAASVTAADIDGDRQEDLIVSCGGADGPANARTNAGEVAIVSGRPEFPARVRLANGEADVTLVGSRVEDWIASIAEPDLNGDGYEDLLIRTDDYDPGRLGAAWIVNWLDVDGDGVTQLHDVCPLVADPSQADADGNGVGDACDGDYDGDGQADADDCAPNRAAGGVPGNVDGLALEGAAQATLTWAPEPFGDRYDVTRGLVRALAPGSYGVCQAANDPDPTDTTFVDSELPPDREGFFYLVRANNVLCPATGTWGHDSAGTERVDEGAGECP